MTTGSRATAGRQRPADRAGTAADDPGAFRQRLLDGLAASIAADGYRATTVADIVRRARTSRRTFYEHFAGRDACLIALLSDANAEVVRHISASVDPAAPWATQVRQAVEAWIRGAQSAPAITLAWIRDLPSLGQAARDLQREVMESFVTMVQTLCDTDEWRSHGVGPVPRQLAVMLLGGLRELIATTVEDGGEVGDITEVAVRASIAVLGPPAPAA
ncbi:TetR/AcrR family transcriptional regulator [Rugosimonospora acidiphila]|uniref:TetR/AcrR family transcriptional regulator n=1 Tax=Rugosimonospora acidiphila TaxID=556531 RepID=A0ABP9RV98_9ACTN